MAAFERNLFVSQSNPSNIITVLFLPPPQISPQNFVAWGAITWIDPRVGAFDANNAIGFDIPYIYDENAALTNTEAVFTGGVLEAPGNDQNLRKSSIVGFGIGVVFRLRIYPRNPPELACVANCVVITNP